MHLAIWLKRIGKYDDVDVEYYVPFEEFGGKYIWESELSLDIVVKKGEEYIPVELKYKTKKVEKKLTRFNEELKREYIVVKDQVNEIITHIGFDVLLTGNKSITLTQFHHELLDVGDDR